MPIAGSEFTLPADTVIPAVSQAADLSFLPVDGAFEVNRGRIKVDPATYATNVRGVFACGDFVTGPTTLTAIVDTGSGSIMSTIFGQVTTLDKQCTFMPTIGSSVVP